MVMKKFFAKENFLSSSFSAEQRRQSLFVSITLAVCFAGAAFAFFHALYGFVDAIGSIVSGSKDVAIKDMLYILPLILVCFMAIWTVLLLQASFRNNEARRIRSYKKNAFALVGFAGVNVIFIIAGLIIGKYPSIVGNGPFPLYPLDMMLFSLLFAAIACFVLFYCAKLQEKLPYTVPTRGPIVQKARFIYCFGVSIWMLIALYGLAAFILGLFIIDFVHGYQFYSIMLMLVFLMDFASMCVWEFYYNNLVEEKKKELLLPLSLCGLGASVFVVALYFVALGTNLDAPSNIGFGVLPIAFAASVNIATLLLVVTPTIVSIIALIKGLLLRKKA